MQYMKNLNTNVEKRANQNINLNKNNFKKNSSNNTNLNNNFKPIKKSKFIQKFNNSKIRSIIQKN